MAKPVGRIYDEKPEPPRSLNSDHSFTVDVLNSEETHRRNLQRRRLGTYIETGGHAGTSLEDSEKFLYRGHPGSTVYELKFEKDRPNPSMWNVELNKKVRSYIQDVLSVDFDSDSGADHPITVVHRTKSKTKEGKRHLRLKIDCWSQEDGMTKEHLRLNTWRRQMRTKEFRDELLEAIRRIGSEFYLKKGAGSGRESADRMMAAEIWQTRCTIEKDYYSRAFHYYHRLKGVIDLAALAPDTRDNRPMQLRRLIEHVVHNINNRVLSHSSWHNADFKVKKCKAAWRIAPTYAKSITFYMESISYGRPMKENDRIQLHTPPRGIASWSSSTLVFTSDEHSGSAMHDLRTHMGTLYRLSQSSNIEFLLLTWLRSPDKVRPWVDFGSHLLKRVRISMSIDHIGRDDAYIRSVLRNTLADTCGLFYKVEDIPEEHVRFDSPPNVEMKDRCVFSAIINAPSTMAAKQLFEEADTAMFADTLERNLMQACTTLREADKEIAKLFHEGETPTTTALAMTRTIIERHVKRHCKYATIERMVEVWEDVRLGHSLQRHIPYVITNTSDEISRDIKIYKIKATFAPDWSYENAIGHAVDW